MNRQTRLRFITSHIDKGRTHYVRQPSRITHPKIRLKYYFTTIKSAMNLEKLEK